MEKLSLIKKNDWHHDCRNTNCFVTYTEQMFSDEQKKCSDKMSIGLDKVKVAPVTLAIGIGRSHFEATSLMLEAMVFGNYNIQSDFENEITERLNQSNIGPLGLGGNTTALGTFIKIGAQRASGVRIVSMRPCCGIEPRKSSVELS